MKLRDSKPTKFVVLACLLVGSSVLRAQPSALTINPLTSTPYVAVHNGDIVDCIVFIGDYKKAQPAERAVLLLPEINKAQQPIIPAVAFTLKGKVLVHSYRTGDHVLTNAAVADLDKPAARVALYSAFEKFLRAYNRANVVGASANVAFLSDANLKTATPSARAGDTDVVQLRRAHARLRQLGVRCALVKDTTGLPGRLVIEYDGLQYYWSNRLFSGYNGLAEKPALNGFVAGTLFAADYRKSHPNEKVAIFLRNVRGRSEAVTATTLFTKSGVVFVHDPRAGDLLLQLKPADLSNRNVALAAADAASKAAADERRRQRTVPPSAQIASAAADFSVPKILGEFQQRKIDARVMGSTSPAVIFKWAGTLYAYDGKACTRTTRADAARLATNP